MEIRYFKSCKDIFIYEFFQILETNDYRYLVKGWDEDEEIAIDQDKAKKKWEAIYEEYCKLSEDNKALLYFAVFSELLYLETRFQVVAMLIQQLIKRSDDKEAVALYAEELKAWKYRINLNNPIDGEIQRLHRQLKQSKNKIRLKKDELEGFKPEKGEEPMSLTEQVVSLELALGKNEINPRTTTVEKFVVMIQKLKEQNKKQASHGRRE